MDKSQMLVAASYLKPILKDMEIVKELIHHNIDWNNYTDSEGMAWSTVSIATMHIKDLIKILEKNNGNS